MAKLTNEQKIEIYERRLKGETLPSCLVYNKIPRSCNINFQ